VKEFNESREKDGVKTVLSGRINRLINITYPRLFTGVFSPQFTRTKYRS